MIKKYAPEEDSNNTKEYADHIIKHSGASRDKKIGEMDEATFKKVMNAIQIKEGNGRPGKEKWVNTTNIIVSDGSRPISNHPFKVTIGTCTYEWVTNEYGKLPPIVHINEGMRIEVKVKEPSGKESTVYSATAGNRTKNLLLKKKFLEYKANTLLNDPQKPREKSEPNTTSYIIQSGDTLEKISKRFDVSVAEITSINNFKDVNKIYPGEKIFIYGRKTTSVDLSEQQPWEEKGNSYPVPSYPSKNEIELKSKQTSIPKKVENIESKGGKSKGTGQAFIPLIQKEAPWMEIAIEEARKWGGINESKIIDNFHKLLSPETKRNLSNTPWCASFVNYCLYFSIRVKSNNYAGSNSFTEKDSNFKKIKTPVYGSLAIWKKGEKGHVAFVYGKDVITNEIIVLGGNQNDSINFMLQSDTTKKFVGLYIPTIYEPDFNKKLDIHDVF